MSDFEKPSPWGRRPDPSGPRDPRDRPPRPPNKGGGPSRLSLFLYGVIGFLFVVLLVAWLLPEGAASGGRMGGLVYDGLLLAFVGAGLWVHVRSSPSAALRNLATWVIIFGILALGYSIWSGTGRIAGELDSAVGVKQGENISFRADMSGHFFVNAEVNGVPVRFMVDTGATDVALTQKDARRIGLPMATLNYNRPYNTANGVSYGAVVRLETVALGPVMTRNIRGSVLQEGLDHSLLGMSFLNTLSGYKVVNGVLTLYP